jgi:hypothetical protein
MENIQKPLAKMICSAASAKTTGDVGPTPTGRARLRLAELSPQRSCAPIRRAGNNQSYGLPARLPRRAPTGCRGGTAPTLAMSPIPMPISWWPCRVPFTRLSRMTRSSSPSARGGTTPLPPAACRSRYEELERPKWGRSGRQGVCCCGAAADGAGFIGRKSGPTLMAPNTMPVQSDHPGVSL